MKIALNLLLILLLISCGTGNKPTNSEGEDTLTSGSPVATKADTSLKGIVKETNQFCGSLAIEILKSSDRYTELTAGLIEAVKKNGGNGVGVKLDKSPSPEKDKAFSYSTRYEMEVSENYPDRQVNIAHFVFDPKKKQLFEYNVVQDQMVEIDFDTGLLNQTAQYCP
ncbi:MAG: hypothetical protein HC830_02015 [Bacteroidetes bacterium]|nr:hypothetical protein [Bacteroidales bacterium]NJO68191.1 hypothetical protein [Bacteroidota bacterium]